MAGNQYMFQTNVCQVTATHSHGTMKHAGQIVAENSHSSYTQAHMGVGLQSNVSGS